MRVVRTETENTVEFSIDNTGKKPGRGAYVCPSAVCLEKAYKQKGLERSYKQAIPPEIYEALKNDMEKSI
jgi:hypothetical protein